MIIYIDSNIFIKACLEVTGEGARAREFLKEVKEGKHTAVTSALTLDEVLWITQKTLGRTGAAEAVQGILLLQNLALVEATRQILTEAVEIFKNSTLDPRDAIHLATMRNKQVTTILSTDSDFDKVKEIKRLRLER